MIPKNKGGWNNVVGPSALAFADAATSRRPHRARLPVEEFLAQHPKVRFHFTPTYSSWLNQVELWFAKIQRDVISRGVFTSVADLARKLRKYIEAYARSAKPFRWTYTDPRKRIRINEITGTAY